MEQKPVINLTSREKNGQTNIDFDFLNQLTKVLDEVNKENKLADLTIDKISGYDGVHFTIDNQTMDNEGLKLYAEKLHKENAEKLFKEIGEEKKQEEENKENWTDI
jgi:hemerythrin